MTVITESRTRGRHFKMPCPRLRSIALFFTGARRTLPGVANSREVEFFQITPANPKADMTIVAVRAYFFPCEVKLSEDLHLVGGFFHSLLFELDHVTAVSAHARLAFEPKKSPLFSRWVS